MKNCFELLKNVLLDAFNISTLYFEPPYENISKIDQGIRASVWTNYNDSNTKVQLSGLSQNENRLLLIRSNLGFYNIMVFWGEEQSTDFISIGPFRNDELSPSYFTQILKESHISPALLQQIRSVYESMPFARVDAVANVVKHILTTRFPAFADVEAEWIQYTEQQRPVEVHPEIIEQNFIDFSEQYHELLSDFLKCLKTGNNSGARKALHLFLHASKSSSKRTLLNYKALLSSLNNYCHMALLDTNIHPSHVLRQATAIGARIDETTSLSKLEQMPNDICHKYCLLVKNYANPECSRLTKDVIAFIQYHMEEELSLTTLAIAFDKNPSFLSHTFSKDMGVSLTKFIQQSRIQEAVRLFNTTKMSVSDVALTVGYQDFSYFSKTFSKFIGMSPREYRLQK